MNKKADELFWWFEQNRFENTGLYPRNTNLVFAFADYVDLLSDEEIGTFLAKNNKELATDFRKTIQTGIDKWIKSNIKTIAII